ncbi:Uncharacterized protein TCM_020040 [Theobroma cacao]|uniref:Uncharacterized protein n=1 Tax=Theobroma cacao TaxID=3641 RepID=A0A061EKF6_THECC|nr:Uncharacterized protein TCM_020040 [Theobroma cacao]
MEKEKKYQNVDHGTLGVYIIENYVVHDSHSYGVKIVLRKTAELLLIKAARRYTKAEAVNDGKMSSEVASASLASINGKPPKRKAAKSDLPYRIPLDAHQVSASSYIFEIFLQIQLHYMDNTNRYDEYGSNV